MRISNARQYRKAVTEMQRFEKFDQGSKEYRRRYEVLAAMHEYEQHHMLPQYRRARPAPYTLVAAAPPAKPRPYRKKTPPKNR